MGGGGEFPGQVNHPLPWLDLVWGRWGVRTLIRSPPPLLRLGLVQGGRGRDGRSALIRWPPPPPGLVWGPWSVLSHNVNGICRVHRGFFAFCYLEIQMIISGEKPYKCMQCLRAFVSSGVLKAHIRTHAGIKAYKCLICDSTFTTNGSLKRHMSTHSEVCWPILYFVWMTYFRKQEAKKIVHFMWFCIIFRWGRLCARIVRRRSRHQLTARSIWKPTDMSWPCRLCNSNKMLWWLTRLPRSPLVKTMCRRWGCDVATPW